jgi:transposase InsO family protein
VVRHDEAAARAERAQAIGLFRYQLIRDAADPGLSSKARGRLVRSIAAAEHTDPFGRRVRVSRDTLDRWIRAWRRGGFDALVPCPRQSAPRLPGEIIELAVALKRENPDRTAAQVRQILRTQLGWAPGERTLQRHFADEGLIRPGSPAVVFGRFEATRPNELWTGDALHGPVVAGRKTYLFAFIDDHSRAVVGHRFGYAEDTVRLAAALRPALACRGVPESIYVDNGSAFVDAWLLRACATLGIKLTHSTPGPTPRPGQNRAILPHGPRAVPHRAWIHRLTLGDHFWVVFGVVDHGVWLRACEYCWSVQLFHCGVSGRAWWGGVCPGQAVCGGAWVAVNRPLKAFRCGQLSGRWSVMRRDRRAILAATVIRWRRMVPVRARAWNRLARQPAARVRLWAMAASASQAAFAANDPEGRCARAESLRSALTCSMIACSRCCFSAATSCRVESVMNA